MTTENPFFKLHDKLTVMLCDEKNAYVPRKTVVSNAVTATAPGFSGGYSEMTRLILNRGVFFFGSKYANITFSEWVDHNDENAVLLAIERAGLLYEERKISPGAKNPYKLVLKIIDDPRVRQSFNSRQEFTFLLDATTCADYGLYEPFSGKTRDVQLDTLMTEMCRRPASYLSSDDQIKLVLTCLMERCSGLKIDPDKRFHTVMNVVALFPFDFEIVRAIIQDCVVFYDKYHIKVEEQLILPANADDSEKSYNPDKLTDIYVG